MTGPNLRLALDVGSVRAEPAGVGNYAAGLAVGLGARLGDDLTLIGVRPEAPLATTAASHRVPFRGRTYHAWLQLHADRDARRAGAQLAHYTNAGAPLWARLPFVVTVHDVSLLRMPGTHPRARLASVPVMLAAVARARAVIVPSGWTRRELLRGLLVSHRRVVVVGHAQLNAPGTAPDPPAVDRVLAEFGLAKGRYLLAIGTIEPRKNLVRLVAAFERLAADETDLRLVICGAPGWRYGPILRRISASPQRERIVVAGYVSQVELAALISGSGAVCYVSTYEGYGMPVIESMALGAAVVTSNRTAMPEAAGGAGVLVDPFDVADIERGLRAALARRHELGAAGRARVAGRDWSKVTEEHLDVYRWALSGR